MPVSITVCWHGAGPRATESDERCVGEIAREVGRVDLAQPGHARATGEDVRDHTPAGMAGHVIEERHRPGIGRARHRGDLKVRVRRTGNLQQVVIPTGFVDQRAKVDDSLQPVSSLR
jgi:hypothetical protein